LVNTENSTIINNTITDNYEGIRIFNSAKNILKNNNMNNNQYNFQADYSQPNNVDSSNKINGKPVYIWINQHDKTVPSEAGYVALVNCSTITVQNLNLTNNEIGIYLQNSKNSILTKNTFSNLKCAIELTSASNNLITQNTITASQDGIKIEDNSTNNSIVNNFISGNKNSGITMESSTANNLQNNKLSGNSQGVAITDSSGNTVKGNSITLNDYGIQFTTLQPYGSFQTTSTCAYNLIIENDLIANENGVYMVTATANNTFCRNNFVNNTQQAVGQSYSSSLTNTWDNGVQGNYWSNYNGTDVNNDGIGDQPQRISGVSDLDRFPLTHPFSPS
jgi:parallel beta-helix repeat protein